MKMTTCTAFTRDGKTHCGRFDMCTTVTLKTPKGMDNIHKMVCSQCRERMNLPGYDSIIDPKKSGLQKVAKA